MSSTDKRKKRAKEKAKQARLQKQQKKDRVNDREFVRASPDILAMFETLPGFSPDYEAVPHIKQFVLSKPLQSDDLEMSVALLYVMYGHWKTSASDALDYEDLSIYAQQIAEQPRFLEQFYSDEVLLEAEV